MQARIRKNFGHLIQSPKKLGKGRKQTTTFPEIGGSLEGWPQGVVRTQRWVAQGSASQPTLLCKPHQVAQFFSTLRAALLGHSSGHGQGPLKGFRAFTGQAGKRELHYPNPSPSHFSALEGRAQLSPDGTSVLSPH